MCVCGVCVCVYCVYIVVVVVVVYIYIYIYIYHMMYANISLCSSRRSNILFIIIILINLYNEN